MTRSTLLVIAGILVLAVAAGANTPQTGYNGTQNTKNGTVPTTSYAAWEFATPGNDFTNGNWTFGEVFVPNQNLPVDYLGYYNPPGGFTSDHPVGIFDANGNLLASTTLLAGTCPAFTAHFCFNSISPITLLAGQTYVVEGVSNADPYTWNDPGFTVYAPITVLGNNWVSNGGLTFNGTGTINDVSDGYWGPNFGWTTTATPEPGSLMLLGTGIVGLGGLLRRKLF